MVPLIFAGMGGGNLPGHTLEWAQTYLANLSIQNQQQQQQIQAQQQQLQQQIHQQAQPQMSPDLHRDSRMIPPNPYGGQQQPPPAQSAPSSVTSQPAPTTNLGRNSISGPQPSTLSRLNTTEFIPNTAPGPNRPPLHPLQHSQPTSIEGSSGPGLFFHHWTPRPHLLVETSLQHRQARVLKVRPSPRPRLRT